MIDLYRINLNLLVALNVLLSEKSVTKAAHKLHMTQAAMSNNLQQLREVFKDELLIREKNYMILSNYAMSLQSSLHQLLEEMRTLITAGQRFCPEASQRVFKLGMSDYLGTLLLPKLLHSLEKNAPGITLTLVSPDRIGDAEAFEHGEYHLAINKLFSHNQNLQKKLLFKDKAVCVMNSKHPLARKKSLSLDDYLAYQHVTMHCGYPDILSLTDEILASLGVERDVKLYTSFMSVIFQLVQESRLLLGTVALKVAHLYQAQGDFVIKPLSFFNKDIEFYLFWHQRYENDLGHAWLREQLMGVLCLPDESGSPVAQSRCRVLYSLD